MVFRSSLQLVRLSDLDDALRKLGAFSEYEDGWFCYWLYSQRGVFIFKSWGTSLQIAFIHTQRACALSLFFNMDLSGFSHIPHPSLVSFCDPGAHISKMLIRSRAATSGPQEATQYKLIVQTL